MHRIGIIEDNLCGEDTIPFGPDELNTCFLKSSTSATTLINSYFTDHVCVKRISFS